MSGILCSRTSALGAGNLDDVKSTAGARTVGLYCSVGAGKCQIVTNVAEIHTIVVLDILHGNIGSTGICGNNGHLIFCQCSNIISIDQHTNVGKGLRGICGQRDQKLALAFLADDVCFTCGWIGSL